MSATEKFEHYEVQKHEDGSLFELGRGAMGITYKALDTDLQCLVALKIINPSTIANTDAEQRFFREARSAAQLRHPNIASVFHLGKTEDGTLYYAMEFCEGQTLQQMIDQSGPIECRRALDFTLQVTKALIVAEERHLVHRDLKPSNLIVTQRSDEGEVIKVIDFGLAKTTAPEGTMWSSMGTHGFIGTAHFASPEQIEDKAVDTRSDIYSLGSTLWFMLLGRPPFEGSLARIMSQHLTAEPDYSVFKGMPKKVVAMIRRMMEKDAADRPQSALELRREINECLTAGTSDEELEGAGEPANAEPPPLPAQKPAEPEEVWTPSLVDLLRIRSALTPAETLRIGEELAAQLDKELAEGASAGVLRIQEVAIHFRDGANNSEIRERLRQRVAAWPAFDLIVTPTEASPQTDASDPSQMTTIIPGGDLIGDKAQQLARLIYELLGGVAGTRYVPLASLGEAGNAVLQRATIVGLGSYPTLRELVEKLRGATEDAALSAASVGVAVAPGLSDKSDTSDLSDRSDKSSSTPSGRPRSTPSALPAPQSPTPQGEGVKKARRSPAKILLSVVVFVIGLFAMYSGLKTIFHKSDSDDAPDATKLRETVRRDIANDADARLEAAGLPSTPNTNTNTQPGAVQFTVFDDLGEGQLLEKVVVFVDDAKTPAGSVTVDAEHPHGSVTITLPQAGPHFFSAQTESVVISNGATKKILASGRWQNDFHGGERYDISATANATGDAYQLRLTDRK